MLMHCLNIQVKQGRVFSWIPQLLRSNYAKHHGFHRMRMFYIFDIIISAPSWANKKAFHPFSNMPIGHCPIVGGGPIWPKSTFKSFAGSFIWSYMLVNRIKSRFWLILKIRPSSGHITFDPAHWKVIFKSVHHPSLWGVYPEVLMALAQNSWENSISLNRLGEKSQKPHFETGIFKTEIKHGFWDFSP